MKSLQQVPLRQIWLVLAVALAVSVLPAPRVQAQSLNTCETWVVDSYGTEQTNCITEWYSQSSQTYQLSATVQVDSYDSNYVPAVDAYISLSDPNGNLGEWDYDQYSEPTGPDPEAYAGVTVTLTPNDVYDLYGGYGACYDPTGSGGYYQDEWQPVWDPYWNNSTEDYVTNIFDPRYQILTLLYPPPGNNSSAGYGTYTTNGTTTSIGSSLEHSTGITFSGNGVFAGTDVTLGYSSVSTDTTAYQTTITNGTGLTELAGKTQRYNTGLVDMPQHTWDSFQILLNPRITTASDDGNNVTGYTADLQPASGAGWLTGSDHLGVVVQDMLNHAVFASLLDQQPLPPFHGVTYYQPGLASICANVIESEYNAQPSTCTDTDQCGCQLSDFKEILAQDDLLRWNKDTLLANPLPAWEEPTDVDGSGWQECSTPNSSTDCRYVPVPVANNNPSPQEITLEYGYGFPVDHNNSTETNHILYKQQSYSAGLSRSFGLLGPLGAKLTTADTWIWSDSKSTGTINGIGTTSTLDLETTTEGCEEQCYLYEDTRYHTFVVQPPVSAPPCTQ